MKNSTDNSTPITTPDYWENNWADLDVPDPINPKINTPENYYYRVMHSLFVRKIGAQVFPGAKVVEIGCGGSRWLPYLHQAFGYEVSGIDYTSAGIQLSQAILDKAGITGCIVQGDLFQPPPDWIGRFDVVFSFGLVEHFENTAQVVAACAQYLRPGGQMVTLVPTMRGLYGLAYRFLRPAIYQKHIPHTKETLTRAHINAGLNVSHCDYVLGLPGIISRPTSNGLASSIAFSVSHLYWRLEQAGWGIPPNRWTSPYALCFAAKPSTPQA